MSSVGYSRFCDKCGAQLNADSAFCPRCGAAVSPSAPSRPTASGQLDWREQRRLEREERRAGHRGIGGLIVATILIVAGLGIYFPTLPWEVFWGGLLIVMGVWIAFAWTRRGRGHAVGQ